MKIEEFMNRTHKTLQDASVRADIDRIVCVMLDDTSYTLDARAEHGRGVLAGTPDEHELKADLTLITKEEYFSKILNGELSAPGALMSGKARVRGNAMVMSRFSSLFKI